MRSAATALIVLAASLLAAADIGSDLSALAPLQACVQANSAGKGYINGWGVTDGGAASSNAILATLAADGVPGVTNPTTTPNPCSTPPWTGIICDAGNTGVTQLDMAAFGPGSLPCDVGGMGSLSGLGMLQTATFKAVGFTGTLPAAWGTGFGALKSLDVSMNKITGSLPAGWSSGFMVANTIDLDSNQISGPLPATWGNAGVFPQLLNLVLGENSLTGPLTSFNGGFTALQLLGLGNNKFSGGLPSGLALGNLRVLELNGNGFTGCLPGTWPAQLYNLTTLRVENDNLSGNIPASYDNWNSLTTISITPGNSFCGTIDSTLATSPPNGQGQRIGNRFDPEPASKNSNGGYDLGACSGSASC